MGQFMIKALTGPVKGKAFPIEQGLKIGRSIGDILLKDQMVSDLHAEIKVYSSGKIMIIDKESKNKIIINDKTVVKSVLEKGSKFKIGETEFELVFTKTPEEILSEFIKKKYEKCSRPPFVFKAFCSSYRACFFYQAFRKIKDIIYPMVQGFLVQLLWMFPF